jgi:hypothetical protein
MTHDLPETKESLWSLAASPLIWAVHFLLSYATAAVWCAKFAGSSGSLMTARIAIGFYTVLALAGIALIARRGWRRHTFDGSTSSHDFDSKEDRHRFLGFATFLLSGLSAIGVIYAALVPVFLETCR